MGFVTQQEREGGSFHGAIRNGVVVEFGSGEEFHPFLRVVGTKDSEIGFDLLIGSFSFSISLRMISSGEADIIVE